ncbi:MAG TPA: Pr6Pr family membrane protein [Lysobacter sp.]
MSSRFRALAVLTAVVAAAALLLQYVLLIRLTLDTIGPAFATIRFFSYFTILSNLLVLLATGTAAFAPQSRLARFFESPRVRAGIALYIGVTLAIYSTILRHLWQPQGAQWWADSALHYAVPVLYLAWWLCCVPHGRVAWNDLPRWLLFPLGYVSWVFLRGQWVAEYPYPFLDVGAHGRAIVLRNALGVFALFLLAGSLLRLLDGQLGRMRKTGIAT